jgi:NADPH-dependent 2,4-dienoyl-CoA reductase/sulfur reductase-like enzyme
VGEAQQYEVPGPEGEDGRTFVLVGAGAGGNAAAQTLREEGFAGRIVMITPEDYGPYDRPTLSKEFLSGEAQPEWLPLRGDEWYRDRGIELLTGRSVVGIDPAGRVIALDDGQTVAYDAALLATGGAPRVLPIDGADLDGVFTLRSRADAEGIGGVLDDARSAVVIGTGFIGMEAAAHLRAREMAVHVVAPDPVPLRRAFGEEIGNYLRRVHEEGGVEFHLGTRPERIEGNGKVERVVLDDGTVLDADIVIVGIGITPVIDYLDGSGLVEDGAVPVDGTLKTRADGVYAAGDIARVPDPRTGETFRIEHWVVAERQGQHAARAMLGSDAEYMEIPFFWTMQFEKSVKYVGYGRKYDSIAVRGSIEEGNFLAGYYVGERLSAVAALGRAPEVIAVAEILKAGRNIPADDFTNEDLDLVGMLTGGG